MTGKEGIAQDMSHDLPEIVDRFLARVETAPVLRMFSLFAVTSFAPFWGMLNHVTPLYDMVMVPQRGNSNQKDQPWYIAALQDRNFLHKVADRLEYSSDGVDQQ